MKVGKEKRRPIRDIGWFLVVTLQQLLSFGRKHHVEKQPTLTVETKAGRGWISSRFPAPSVQQSCPDEYELGLT